MSIPGEFEIELNFNNNIPTPGADVHGEMSN